MRQYLLQVKAIAARIFLSSCSRAYLILPSVIKLNPSTQGYMAFTTTLHGRVRRTGSGEEITANTFLLS